MDYETNSIASFLRILIFSAAGDGKLSKDELNEVIEANASLEDQYERAAGFKGLMMSVLDEAFGIEREEEEEEEEEEVNLTEISEDELNAITEDVLSQLGKCSSAADLKTYSSLICSRITDETLKKWACQASFSVSRADHIDTLVEDNELRNIKYIHKDLGQDFKEAHKNYLHSLTWYDDDYLVNDKGETDLKVIDGDIDPDALLIMKAAFAVTFSDWRLDISNTQFSGTYFMALCDLARLNKSNEIAVPSVEVIFENIQKSVDGIQDHMIADLGRDKIDSSIETSRSMWEKFNNEEEADEEHSLVAAFELEWGESMNKYIKNLIKDVSDLKVQKTLYKISYLLSEADDDRSVLNRVVVHHMTFDGVDDGSVDEHSIQERTALDLIEETFDFDEDTSYVLHNKLSSGEFRGL